MWGFYVPAHKWLVQPYPGDLKLCLIMNCACIGSVSHWSHNTDTSGSLHALHCSMEPETESKLLETHK